MKKIFLSFGCIAFTALAFGQSKVKTPLTNTKGSSYKFTVIKDNEATNVRNQERTGTCWSFSTVGFFESELLREGKGYIHLAPMFVVREAYFDKAEKYIRMHGKINFGQGGESFDIPYVWKNYGVMPYEAYSGLINGDTIYNHSELYDVLKAMLDVYIKHPGGKLSPTWRKAVNDVLDDYLGKVPENFTYKGKTYTPKSFAQYLGLDLNNYVSVTSLSNHPFYTKFALEIPDNWEWRQSYNVTLDDMMKIIDNSLKSGYSIAWGADVSNRGFSFKKGLAIIPEDPKTLINPKSRDSADTVELKKPYAFMHPVPQKKITQENRQQAYDEYVTTDDHGMIITGMYKDQNGDIYYKVKNSWGTKNYDKGYFYVSKAYVEYYTTGIFINKNGIPSAIRKKMGL